MPGKTGILYTVLGSYCQSASRVLRSSRVRINVCASLAPRPSLVRSLRTSAQSLTSSTQQSALYKPRPYISVFTQPRTFTRPLSARSPLFLQRKPPHTPLKINKSGFGCNWASAAVFGLIGGTLILYTSYNKRSTLEVEKDRVNKTEVESSFEVIQKDNSIIIGDKYAQMTGEALAGRPGTLTPEQDEKLREFWAATLQVFGVLEDDRAKVVSENGPEVLNQPHRAESTKDEKPKKKKSMFSRKHKDTDGVPATPAVDEDKYGQTKQFHDALANQTPELLRATFWSMVKHDHPDALLLRFLRARKWDVEKALIMMVSTMNWRATEMHVDDDIMRSGEEGSLEASKSTDPAKKKLGEDFLAQMRMGKSFLHGLDKQGRPMCFVRVRLHKQGEQSEESLERYTVYVIESARMILASPVDTACVVFDMTGFSLANMDYSPVKFMIKCFEANYPESLGVVLVHKAPWVFQGIWKIIRGWLDPVVASKVHFTNNVAEMEEFVPRSNILKDLGGDEDWSYQYIEVLAGENDKMKDTKTKDELIAGRKDIVGAYEEATVAWIDQGTDGATSEIKDKRHRLANELRDGYWKLDPYLRARSVYDRAGMLQSGGKLQFYPPPPALNGDQKIETTVDDID